MIRIGLTASEMSFENVHEDRHRFPEYTISSGELIKACVIKIGWGDDDGDQGSRNFELKISLDSRVTKYPPPPPKKTPKKRSREN